MSADDVKLTLDEAIERTGADQVVVKHRPRLLSDNGPCYLSKELKEYLNKQKMEHTRGAPYHPQTQGKIERYHRSMKNVVKLENYYYPWDLEKAIGQFVDYYNHQTTVNNPILKESITWKPTFRVWGNNCLQGAR